MGLKPGPTPKPKDQRHHRVKRPEIGIVPAERSIGSAEPRRMVPRPPAGLLVRTRKVWHAYWSSQVSNAADMQADTHRIERWIRWVDEFEKCMGVFVKTRLVKGSTGQPVLNPLAQHLQNVEQNIVRAEAELGLTPNARLRLGITYGQAMLTADALNRLLDEPGPGEASSILELADGDWEAV